ASPVSGTGLFSRKDERVREIFSTKTLESCSVTTQNKSFDPPLLPHAKNLTVINPSILKLNPFFKRTISCFI
ncbi:MAG: hypothetical protein ACO3AC_06635, partial [Hylemonella sp.]